MFRHFLSDGKDFYILQGPAPGKSEGYMRSIRFILLPFVNGIHGYPIKRRKDLVQWIAGVEQLYEMIGYFK